MARAVPSIIRQLCDEVYAKAKVGDQAGCHRLNARLVEPVGFATQDPEVYTRTRNTARHLRALAMEEA